jgi:hypothetical protein
MRTHPLTLVVVLALAPMLASAQSKNADLGGLWDGARNTQDLVQVMKADGQPIPFTALGLESQKKIDYAKNPNGFCLPPGPSRAITGPSPFQIVQSPDIIGILFENHFVYRTIYVNGKHPEDIDEYPAFMGHSTGKWQGDTLVVDTVGIKAGTWLDSNGLEHSGKLRLTETFQRAGDGIIHYSVTYDDPVMFTKPWTLKLDLKRLTDTRLLEYVCEENERDSKRLVTTPKTPTQGSRP